MKKVFFLFFMFCVMPAFCEPVNLHILRKKLQEPPPQWMIEQIEEDLAPFKEGGIDQEKIRNIGNLHQKALHLIPIEIDQGKVCRKIHEEGIACTATFRKIVFALSILAKEAALPHIDLFFCQADAYENRPRIDCPVFCVCKYKERDGILIPSFDTLDHFNNPYHDFTIQVKKGSKQYPWREKKEKGFWRGKPTDVTVIRDWPSFPRSQLVLLSQKFPRYLDAKFSDCCRPLLRQILQEKDLLTKRTPIQEHIAYKYLIDADGVSSGWSQCYWILLSNSLMFKQESPFMQWYYRAIYPWEHYVPAKRDFSDLIEKIDWAKNHDVKAKKIAQKATVFAEENLNCEMQLVYLYHALKAYASLLK